MTSLGTIVVVGGSLAGLRSVEALRRRGYGGRIVWIGDETVPPYDRPPLSKQLLDGTWPAERLRFRRDEGYETLDVDQRFGRRATRLDPTRREVWLDDGDHAAWDGLVIATGASPRRIPATKALGGVHVLRTLDDAIAIRDAVAAGARVTVLGAGFIGLEVAASCRKRGAAVTVVEIADIPLSHAIGPEVGAALAAIHRDEGVDLRTGARVTDFIGDGRIEAIRLADGSRVETDLLVVGIGVTPNTAWLDGSGIACDDGVACDARLGTTVPNVVAAGDVARFPHPLFAESMRIEHWTNAVEQANAAVGRLLDGDAVPPFASVPYFWSDQYDVKVQFAGRHGPGDAMRVIEGSLTERKAVVLFGRAGKVSGVLALNRPAALIKYRRAIADGMAFEA